MLSVLLEGESLFNDASSILLFQVFLKGSLEGGSGPDLDLHTLLPQLVSHTCYLTFAGGACGLLMGFLIRWVWAAQCWEYREGWANAMEPSHTLLPQLVSLTCYLTIAGGACGLVMGLLIVRDTVQSQQAVQPGKQHGNR
jgi:hypothetical protein